MEKHDKRCENKAWADCGTDHELLVATLKTKLKKLKKMGDRMNVYDCNGITPEYRVEIKNRFKILERDEMAKDEDANELWEKTKRTILETAEKHIPKKKKGKTTQWLSKEAISLADERKDAKRVGDKDEVRSLNRAFQKQAREDKEKRLNDMCKVMEEEGNKGRTKEMFSKVKEITRKFTQRMGSLKSRDGEVIGDEEGIKERY